MQPNTVKVVMINAPGTGVTQAEMVACAGALTAQAQQHFALPPPYGYGVGAQVRVGSSPFDVHPDEWVLALLVKVDVDGALGYHDQTAHGQPVMKIFPLLDAQDGSRWETTASHELLETLADPNCARCAQSYDGRVWAYEVCDAVEADSYDVLGVPMSNFVLPAYFEPVKTAAKYDWMGLVKQPLEIRDGGYGQWLDQSHGWTQVLSDRRAPRAYRLSVAKRRQRRGSAYLTGVGGCASATP